VIAHEDGAVLAVLSSRVHVCWALAAGGRLGIGNDPRYNNSRCFDPFPFPDLPGDASLTNRLRELGERLDAHRKSVQAAHPDLTLTGLYNVLERLRSGETLTPKERDLHDCGLVTVLKELHDAIDLATLEAYGWTDLAQGAFFPGRDRVSRSANHPRPPVSLDVSELPVQKPPAQGGPDAEALEQIILSRLVGLNHRRAAEEAEGKVRWLRPAYQNPTGAGSDARSTLGLEGPDRGPATTARPVPTGESGALAWPKELPLQVALVRELARGGRPTPDALSARFGRKSAARTAQIQAILETLDQLGWK